MAAKALGRFTVEDFDAAEDFRTCAVGEQREAHPLVVLFKKSRREPRDKTLNALGMAFYWEAVTRNDAAKADELLDQIEDRVLQLKREAR